MAEEVAGMVEASVVAVAISVAAISPAAVVISVVVGAVSTAVISVGLAGVVLVAIALRNTEEGISSTGITSSMETVSGTKIGSGTIAISFLEVPFCMITPTMGMTTLTMGMIILTTGIIIRTGTTDIRTTGMRTSAFADNRCSGSKWPNPERSDRQSCSRRFSLYRSAIRRVGASGNAPCLANRGNGDALANPPSHFEVQRFCGSRPVLSPWTLELEL
jgi:hypothetical protein